MGLYNDIATSGDAMKAAPPRVGLGRSSAHQLETAEQRSGEASVATAYAAADAVARIATFGGTVTAGTYTLTVSLPAMGIEYTTGAIDWNSTAATIETALDAASPAAVGDGDIVVAEQNSAGLLDGYCDFTCEDTVAGQPCYITIDGTSLVGGTAGAVSQTTYGQQDRPAAQALFDKGVVTGTLNKSGVAPSNWTVPATNSVQSKPRMGLIRALGVACAVEDGSDEILARLLELYPTLHLV